MAQKQFENLGEINLTLQLNLTPLNHLFCNCSYDFPNDVAFNYEKNHDSIA